MEQGAGGHSSLLYHYLHAPTPRKRHQAQRKTRRHCLQRAGGDSPFLTKRPRCFISSSCEVPQGGLHRCNPCRPFRQEHSAFLFSSRRLLRRTKEQHEHLVALEEEEVLRFVGHGASKTPPRLLRGGGRSVRTKVAGSRWRKRDSEEIISAFQSASRTTSTTKAVLAWTRFKVSCKTFTTLYSAGSTTST